MPYADSCTVITMVFPRSLICREKGIELEVCHDGFLDFDY